MNHELTQIRSDARNPEKFEATLGYFGEVAQRHLTDLSSSIESGVELLLATKFVEAREWFQQSLHPGTGHPLAVLGLGDCYLKEMAPLKALTVFNRGLQDYTSEPEFYAKATQALLSYLVVIDQEKQPDRLASELNEAALFEALVLQEQCPEHLSQFVRILSGFYSRNTTSLPLIVAKLKPFLKDLYDRGKINKNMVLALILVRDGIEDRIAAAEVSQLHQQYFHQFNSEEVKFPYNFSFMRYALRKNKQDLREIATRLMTDPETAASLELHHLLCLAWLHETEIGAYFQQTIGQKMLAAIPDGPLLQPRVNAEAARVLCLRYLDNPSFANQPHLTAALTALAGSADYARQVEEVATTRSHLTATRDQSLGVARPLTQQKVYQAWNALSHLAKTKLPFSLGKRSQPKVAVCVSGQLRGFRQAFPTWQRTFLADVDYDIYVHTWKGIGRSEPTPFRVYKTFEGENFIKAYKSAFNLISYEDMVALYPSLFSYIRGSQNITAAELESVYGTRHIVIDDEQEERFRSFSNPDKMHYKIYSCHQLALSQGKDYDLYVRIRPDKPMSLKAFDWQDIYRRCRSESLIFTDGERTTHYGHPTIGDQFAVGDQHTMTAYTSTWQLSPAIGAHGLLNWPEQLEGHLSLALTCWAHGIAVEKMPIRWSDLLDSEPLPLETVLEKIRLDAAGRMSELDQQFIQALELDLAAR